MLQAVASGLSRFCARWVPDAYVIALALTAVVFGVALVATPHGPGALVGFWGASFWDFIPFTFQMAFVVLSGYIVADAPVSRRVLGWLAARPRTPRGAIALVAAVSMALAWLNWGFSIVASALLARRLARRPIGVDFRLLVAAAYLGLGCLWHAGLSASAPLTSSDPSQKFVQQYLGGPVPVTATVFSPFNLALSAVVFVVMILVAAALHPREPVTATAVPADDDASDGPDEAPAPARTPAEWLERTPALNLLLVAGIAAYLPTVELARININHVNLLFLGLGALLHGTPASLLRSAERGGRYVWGVLLQFGLYAAVGGILDRSGLAGRIADAFTAVASPRSFPLLVVWYSGILNYLVPSGGAKWLIEVQYVVTAGGQLGVPVERTIVAYAWGDMLTDIIQPFWAIPLLAIAGLGFRDIMGFCVILFAAYAAVVSGAFLLLGLAG